METKIWLAVVTSALSLVVAIVSAFLSGRNQRDLAILKDGLAARAAYRNARLEYEFEARKRLYQHCGPLLFQLSEFAERALGRITRIAHAASDRDLDPGRSWLDRGGYFTLSTYYRLIAPLSVGQLIRRKLTNVDLSLDSNIHWQYVLIKQLADSFTDDFELAGNKTGHVTIEEEHRLVYEPHHRDAEKLRRADEARYWQQGIPRGILENAESALIVTEADGSERVMDFLEFQEAIENRKSKERVRPTYDRIIYFLEGFHPRTRPVLWRILVAQAHIYQALILARQAVQVSADIWEKLWEPDKFPDFDWRNDEEKRTVPEEEVSVAVKIGAAYAMQTTAEKLAKLTTEATARRNG